MSIVVLELIAIAVPVASVVGYFAIGRWLSMEATDDPWDAVRELDAGAEGLRRCQQCVERFLVDLDQVPRSQPAASSGGQMPAGNDCPAPKAREEAARHHPSNEW